MILLKKKKRGRKNKKNRFVSNGFFSMLTFSSLFVIIFVFHLFLYKQIENLNMEKENIRNRIEETIDEKNNYDDKYNLTFDQNEENIANNFYGYNQWERQTVIKDHITLDR